MLDPTTTTKHTDIDDEILALGGEIRRLNGDPGIFLGPASDWLTKDGRSTRTDETALMYPLRRSTDNTDIGHVYCPHGRWQFKIFGSDDIPVIGYDTKEEALIGAIRWISPS